MLQAIDLDVCLSCHKGETEVTDFLLQRTGFNSLGIIGSGNSVSWRVNYKKIKMTSFWRIENNYKVRRGSAGQWTL